MSPTSSLLMLGTSMLMLGLLLGSGLWVHWRDDPDRCARWMGVLLGVALTVWLPAWFGALLTSAWSLPPLLLPLLVLASACFWLWVVVRMALSSPSPNAGDALCLLLGVLLSFGMLASSHARRRR
jgi:hypothetical protein